MSGSSDTREAAIAVAATGIVLTLLAVLAFLKYRRRKIEAAERYAILQMRNKFKEGGVNVLKGKVEAMEAGFALYQASLSSTQTRPASNAEEQQPQIVILLAGMEALYADKCLDAALKMTNHDSSELDPADLDALLLSDRAGIISCKIAAIADRWGVDATRWYTRFLSS